MSTYWTPDEFWQAHEVAHNIVFGCGHLTWEWQPEWKVRSPAHPLIFATVYNWLFTFGLDHPLVIAAAPRFVQSLMAAFTDIATIEIASITMGRKRSHMVMFCQLLNWFNSYGMLRTYSSSLEAMLTAVVFRGFVAGAGINAWLPVAALACIVRPTAALLWVCPWCYEMYRAEAPVKKVMETIRIGVVAIGVAVAVDSAFYGELTYSGLNFLKFNFINGHSALYGTHHLLWYFLQGLPAVLGAMTPLMLFINWRDCPRKLSTLASSIAISIAFHSAVPHKELRFLLPCMPVLMVFAGAGMWCALQRLSTTFKKFLVVLLVVTNVAAFLFLAMYHQRAPIACTDRLLKEMLRDPDGFSVDFLTPCHATPYASHLHSGTKCPDLRFLDCSPRWLGDGSLTRDGTDSDLFFHDGADFVETYYKRPSSRKPRFVVTTVEAMDNVSVAFQTYELVGRFESGVEGSEGLVLLREP